MLEFRVMIERQTAEQGADHRVPWDSEPAGISSEMRKERPEADHGGRDRRLGGERATSGNSSETRRRLPAAGRGGKERGLQLVAARAEGAISSETRKTRSVVQQGGPAGTAPAAGSVPLPEDRRAPDSGEEQGR